MEYIYEYIEMSLDFVFKFRSDGFYFINTKDSLNKRFLVGEGAESVLIPLFEGRSINEVAVITEINPDELRKYIASLLEYGVIKLSDYSIDSSNQCFKILPPLDVLNMVITDECNLDCGHCLSNSGKIKEDEVSGNLWIRTLKQAKEIGVFGLNISGGEPFLSKDFLKILTYLQSEKYFQVNLNTNGTISVDKYLDILSESVSTVQISIDGGEKTHDSFRRKTGAFQKSVKTIKQLISSGISVNVAFSLSTTNLNSLDDVISICKNLGVERLNIGFINPVGRALNNNCPFITYKSLQKGDFLDKIIVKFLEIEKKHGDFDISFPFDIKGEPNGFITNNRFICGGGLIQSMSVTSDGKVTPCGMLLSEKFFCGNIKNQSVKDIWLSEKMRYYRTMPLKKIPSCGDCKNIQYCGKPCMVRMFHSDPEMKCTDLARCLITEKILSLRSK